MTTISSSDVEKAYLAFCVPGADAQAAILKFQAGKHNYELDFKGTSYLWSRVQLPILTWGLGCCYKEGKEDISVPKGRETHQQMTLSFAVREMCFEDGRIRRWKDSE